MAQTVTIVEAYELNGTLHVVAEVTEDGVMMSRTPFEFASSTTDDEVKAAVSAALVPPPPPAETRTDRETLVDVVVT